MTPDRRQTLAVEAYCRELCPPAAAAAAAEILHASAHQSDAELLRHTRAIAAKHAVSPRRRLRRGLPVECAATPGRLAARSNEELAPAEREVLGRHLDTCLNCQAAELRSQSAERAFAGIAGVALAGHELASKPAPVPVPAAVEPPPAAPVEAPTSEWLTTAAPLVAPATAEAAADAPPVRSGRRRRPPRAGLALVAAVAAAAVIAVVALSAGHSHKAPAIARSTTPATTPAPATPTHHRAAKRAAAKAHHSSARKHAVHKAAHHAAPATSATPAVASITPAPSATPSAPTSSSAPSSSPPASSSTPTSSGSSGASSQSSTPSVSISQPSLGSTSAPQGVSK